MLNIKNHELQGDGIFWQPSPNTSGRFKPSLPDTIVIHFTGGRSVQSSANWLCNRKAKASAHLVIGREGEIFQLAKFNTVAWHAGRSHWENRSGFNRYSIGIELDNVGRLEKREAGYYTWFGQEVAPENVIHATHRNESVPTYWQSFTPQQIDLTEEICAALIDKYEIKLVLGHEEISPGRKVDPGPACPLDSLRKMLIPDDRGLIAGVEEDEPQMETAGVVTADVLNIRQAPNSLAPLAASPLQQGTTVRIQEKQGDWYKVKVEAEGWVNKNWINKT